MNKWEVEEKLDGSFSVFCYICNSSIGVATVPDSSEYEQRQKALAMHCALYHSEVKDENSKS